ncbi:hypothetical protein FGO68_gene16441 [Halteria grandinella]|uniref:Uncharacterized protein n=1 Tax=Halteria grandinella TaxID=5974 RepID=A0A8J8NBB7_HALGN|nr:hypothetical protein FGO68_gene16441 [Halteria grandinella]
MNWKQTGSPDIIQEGRMATIRQVLRRLLQLTNSLKASAIIRRTVPAITERHRKEGLPYVQVFFQDNMIFQLLILIIISFIIIREF